MAAYLQPHASRHVCPEGDALSIDLMPGAQRTETRNIGPGDRLHFDADGRLIGVEVRSASVRYPRSALSRLPAPGQGAVREVELYLSRKADATWRGAVVYQELDGSFILERPGQPALGLGRHFGIARNALLQLRRAAQT